MSFKSISSGTKNHAWHEARSDCVFLCIALALFDAPTLAEMSQGRREEGQRRARGGGRWYDSHAKVQTIIITVGCFTISATLLSVIFCFVHVSQIGQTSKLMNAGGEEGWRGAPK